MGVAGLLQALRQVLLPLLWPSLAGGMLLDFLQAPAELTLSAFLAGPGTETLGWLVIGLAQGGYSKQAAALRSLIMVAMAAAAGLLALVAGRARGWAN